MRIVARNGGPAFGVTTEVEAQWLELEQQARDVARERGLDQPFLRFLTDTGAFGVYPLPADAPTMFQDIDGQPANYLGTINFIAIDEGNSLAEPASPQCDLSDEQRIRFLEQLQSDHPDLDVEWTAAGSLAGPATPDRPPVPPWDYPPPHARSSGRSIDQVAQIRFPIRFDPAGESVSSQEEEARPPRRGDTPDITPTDVADKYQLLHEHGLVDWDEQSLTVVYSVPVNEIPPAVTDWWHQRRRAPNDDRP